MITVDLISGGQEGRPLRAEPTASSITNYQCLPTRGSRLRGQRPPWLVAPELRVEHVDYLMPHDTGIKEPVILGNFARHVLGCSQADVQMKLVNSTLNTSVRVVQHFWRSTSFAVSCQFALMRLLEKRSLHTSAPLQHQTFSNISST